MTNSVSGAKVLSVLPSYVKWLDNISPSGGQVTFNPVSREVVWDLGGVKENTGISTSPREIAFQVSLLPSQSQVGGAPIVIGVATLSGVDDFTADSVGVSLNALNTEIKNDPNYVNGQERGQP